MTISNRFEFQAHLDHAIAQIGLIQAKSPDPMLAYAEKQLKNLKAWTAHDNTPTDEQLHTLSFGTIASRDIHDCYPELAEQLYALAGYMPRLKPR